VSDPPEATRRRDLLAAAISAARVEWFQPADARAPSIASHAASLNSAAPACDLMSNVRVGARNNDNLQASGNPKPARRAGAMEGASPCSAVATAVPNIARDVSI
jgi:hypothetical protein